ncbi:MAG: DegV family protein [Limnochordia bacterium]|nr:DegV family protein [Limnochordia bacterium]
MKSKELVYSHNGGVTVTVKIITDSACDLPQDIVQEYDIEVLPFLVYIDHKEYRDGVNITTRQVYDAIRQGSVPTTGQVPMDAIVDTFKKYAQEGRQCIYLSFSSKLSGTYNTARLVAQEMKKNFHDFQVTVVDTLSGSLGQGLIALEAAQMAKANADTTHIIDRVQRRASSNVEHLFSVDDLHYLYRGGRLSYASSFLGGLLQIKPILHVQEGLMIPFQKVRGKKMAVKRLVELVKERSLGDKNQIIGITHADDATTAKQLQSLLQNTLGYKNIIVNLIGSVLACHIGIGGVAAFVVNTKLPEPNCLSSGETI